ncbi:MAG TPA: NifU family protein [Candidatus Eremiobacteraeota bacterium]|nr:MAG: Fe/S biogenesis protein NfuA [bacterium ADurb.Bin363]HPZ06655.1 NifU family protein [Candidatus Eremiobacteraeota bacterium]
MKETVEKVIAERIRPGLQADGGDIELVEASEEGVIKVKLQGACSGCPMAQMTLQFGVEKVLREAVPGFKELIRV